MKAFNGIKESADFRAYVRGSKCAGQGGTSEMSKAFQVTIDDNRSIVGKAFHGGVMFQFANGACITRISLTYAAINSMGQIAEAVKAAEENKKAANAKRRAANAKRRATKGGEA